MKWYACRLLTSLVTGPSRSWRHHSLTLVPAFPPPLLVQRLPRCPVVELLPVPSPALATVLDAVPWTPS